MIRCFRLFTRAQAFLITVTGLTAISLAPPIFAANKTVLISADAWCPYNCDDSSQEPGFMIDLAREILGQSGYTVVYRNQAWKTAMADVASGKIDAVVGAGAIEAKDLTLAGVPLGENQTCFYTRMDDLFQYKPGMSLVSRRVGVISGYLYEDSLDQYLLKNRADYNIVQVATGDKPLLQNIRKLKARRIDTLVENMVVMDFSIAKYRVDGIRLAGCEVPRPLFIAFSPKREDSHRLADAMNEGMRVLRKNGRLSTILARYGLTDWNGSASHKNVK